MSWWHIYIYLYINDILPNYWEGILFQPDLSNYPHVCSTRERPRVHGHCKGFLCTCFFGLLEITHTKKQHLFPVSNTHHLPSLKLTAKALKISLLPQEETFHLPTIHFSWEPTCDTTEKMASNFSSVKTHIMDITFWILRARSQDDHSHCVLVILHVDGRAPEPVQAVEPNSYGLMQTPMVWCKLLWFDAWVLVIKARELRDLRLLCISERRLQHL